MSKFRFNESHFKTISNITGVHATHMVIAANKALDEHLATCKVVYGIKDKFTEEFNMSETQCASDTHCALLFDLEEIPKKEDCPHYDFSVEHAPYGLIKFHCDLCKNEIHPTGWTLA